MSIRSKTLFILCLIFGTSLAGQVNVKIGYNIGIPTLSNVDQLFSEFNPAGEVVDPFGDLKFLHGIQLGVRYKLGNTAFEFGWESMNRDRTALAYQAATDNFRTTEYNVSLGGFTLGMDSYFGRYGIGSTLLFQKLGVDRIIGNNDLSLVNDRQLGLRLQFIWQVQNSEMVSLMIKPYYQFALGDYDVGRLASDLGLPTDINVLESPRMFGLSLVFYNGRQN